MFWKTIMHKVKSNMNSKNTSNEVILANLVRVDKIFIRFKLLISVKTYIDKLYVFGILNVNNKNYNFEVRVIKFFCRCFE